ncbi:hypothetical protein WICPIJ_005870 [Wickerhamomyces pijperi]|uniref:FAR-17a/AIG1-like protein n=1 Tax=Wickerhamomyces pijperi TaxID=599730 RepID=A0A9P8Q2R8_WICPI|nr:hypothetical protein WICPIJ_005870 [Wickerhamomyces pijperi]
MSSNAINRVSTVPYLIYNSIGLGVCSYGLVGVLARKLPPELEKAGHLQFLTNLSLLFTMITIVSNFLVSPFTNDKNHWFNKLNLNLNAVALVLESLVTMIYWVLKLFLVHLIVLDSVPKEEYIPLGLDLTIHLFPSLFLSFDYYFIKKTSFKLPFFQSTALVCAATGTYWCILESLVTADSKYPYPFLNVETEKRILIFVTVSVIGIITFYTYEVLHSIVQSTVYEFEEIVQVEGKKEE